MKISESAVKNYQFTIVIFLLLIALGIYSYLKIPQAEDPGVPYLNIPHNSDLSRCITCRY